MPTSSCNLNSSLIFRGRSNTYDLGDIQLDIPYSWPLYNPYNTFWLVRSRGDHRRLWMESLVQLSDRNLVFQVDQLVLFRESLLFCGPCSRNRTVFVCIPHRTEQLLEESSSIGIFQTCIAEDFRFNCWRVLNDSQDCPWRSSSEFLRFHSLEFWIPSDTKDTPCPLRVVFLVQFFPGIWSRRYECKATFLDRNIFPNRYCILSCPSDLVWMLPPFCKIKSKSTCLVDYSRM